jgi:Uma2 family endonuclease
MSTVAPPLLLGPADHGRIIALDEFLDADFEDGYRYELGRGVLEVSQVPNDPHGQVVTNLYDAISLYRRMFPDVVLRYGGGAEFQFALPVFNSGRNPDLGVVLRGAPNDWRGRKTAALAAEVVSAESVKRDYETKREEYLAFGLLEYWIVDPLERKFTLLTRRGDTWSETVLRDGQIIASLVLPGLTVSVADLWADLDALSEEASSDV